MSKQPPGPLCSQRLGSEWIDTGTMCRSQSSSPGPTGLSPTQRRQRAKALKAADARALIKVSLPLVLEHMTREQIQRVQRVLDAAVLNPDIQNEASELYRRSVVARSGALTQRNPRMVRRAERAMEGLIRVTEADYRIRLDFKALLAPDALRATTSNPDEVAYLEKIRQTLETKGVWLRFAPAFVRDPNDPSRHIVDGRTFQAWLSLGPDGDTIPTESGRLTRDALLDTTSIGAGYYRHVHEGPVKAALEKEINRLWRQIEIGIEQHGILFRMRGEAAAGVPETSDLLGGVKFPGVDIWNKPISLVKQAGRLRTEGDVPGAQVHLIAAAIETINAAHLLADSHQASLVGAKRAVIIIEVAEAALLILALWGSAALAIQFARQYLARNPTVAKRIIIPTIRSRKGWSGYKPLSGF